MVYIFIENILSTSKNRPLYEALWLLAVTKNCKAENINFDFDSISITSICNDLILQLKSENTSNRKFIFSSQLVFGTLQLYRIQIDKLFDQTKLALQSFNCTFYNSEWLTQNTSTAKKSTQNASQKRANSVINKKTGKKITSTALDFDESPCVATDFELLESFFNIEVEQVNNSCIRGSKKRKSIDDSGIDPIMTSSIQEITIFETKSLITPGYDTMFSDLGVDDFGDDSELGFENLLKDIGDVVDSQENLIKKSSKLLPRETTENISKKRRLTCYVADDESIDMLQKRSIQQPIDDDHTFENNLIENTKLYDEPQSYQSENNFSPQSWMQSDKNLNQMIFKSDESSIGLQGKIYDQQKHLNKKRKSCLIVDRETMLSEKSIIKSIEEYELKMIVESPFKVFEKFINQYKTPVNELFRSHTCRLKNSKLCYLYIRNLKKVPEKLSMKRRSVSLDEKENQPTQKRAKTDVKDEHRNPLGELNFNIPQVVENYTNINSGNDQFVLPNGIENLPSVFPKCKNENSMEKSNMNEGSKNSRKKILLKLVKYWNKTQEVTMKKLTIGMNRIAAAHVFFELLILSKQGVIELTHFENSLEVNSILCKKLPKQLQKKLESINYAPKNATHK